MSNVLSERAMLARLNIRQWTARRLDKRVTDKVNQEHGAANDAGRYNKLLVSKNALAEIQRIAGAARDEHYSRTLPWHDEGARILSAAGYMAYADAMRKHRQEFESAVASFVAGYPDFVADARTRLNGLFNAADYPACGDVESRFAFSIGIDPCPDAADFRVDIGDAQAEAIRADIEARAKQAMADATRDVWQRIADRVGHMAERLRAYDPPEHETFQRLDSKGKQVTATRTTKEASGVFRDSLVENVRELVALLPFLNVTGDSALAAVADRMQALCRDDATTLRNNGAARASVAAEAESILADVQSYLA